MIERSIIDAASRLRRNREPHMVATVVRVHGSSFRRPGARMLLTQFRWISGSASGSSLEDDIASKGWAVTRNGESVVIRYDARSPAGINDDVRAAFGLGCEGVVDVMLERAGTPGKLDPLEVAERCVRMQRRGAIVTVIGSEAPGIQPGMRVAVIASPGSAGARSDADAARRLIASPGSAGARSDADAARRLIDHGEVLGDSFAPALRAGMIADARAAIATGESCNHTYRSDLGNVDVFVETILPPPRVFVFGTGHDAVPLVALARSLGWEVCVCGNEERVSIRQRFTGVDEILVGADDDIAARIDECDRAIAVVMSHNYAVDRAHLGMLVATHCRYIGMLGPRARTHRMLAELGLGLNDDTRIRSPVGLEIGAETPQEVALAIASEVQSMLAYAPGERLRDQVLENAATSRPRTAEAVAAAAPVSDAVRRISDGPVTGTNKRITAEGLPTAAT